MSNFLKFEEASRAEFVTGFRKRKLERRKVAEEHMKLLARKQKLEERAERRAETAKHRPAAPAAVPAQRRETEAAAPEVVQFEHTGNLKTTAVIAPLRPAPATPARVHQHSGPSSSASASAAPLSSKVKSKLALHTAKLARAQSTKHNNKHSKGAGRGGKAGKLSKTKKR
eukprot:TRINITY_DN17899_c0_g1_i1.p2 TRINITY_DN17899_c0_g1~~TRINITY_DN17899_c0_g1_i1.p2  ORF type:complete len:170 (-),score=40.59 TRINITY_DN17899_c0_g1_i1:20-529(-)